MNADGKITTLNKLIANEQGFINLSFLWAGIIFACGLTASILLFSSGILKTSDWMGETVKLLNGIPALLGTAFGVFSLKDYFFRKNRVLYYQYLQTQYEYLKKSPTPADNSELDEIDKRFDEIWVNIAKL